MTIRKTLAACSAAVLSIPTAVLAQEGSSTTVDVSAAGDAVDAIGTALSGLISGKITTNVLLILGAGLILTAIFLGVRWMLRGGKTAAKG